MASSRRKVLFRTEGGVPVPAVTAEEMREVDSIAPAAVLYEEFGITVENVVGQAKALVGR